MRASRLPCSSGSCQLACPLLLTSKAATEMMITQSTWTRRWVLSLCVSISCFLALFRSVYVCIFFSVSVPFSRSVCVFVYFSVPLLCVSILVMYIFKLSNNLCVSSSGTTPRLSRAAPLSIVPSSRLLATLHVQAEARYIQNMLLAFSYTHSLSLSFFFSTPTRALTVLFLSQGTVTVPDFVIARSSEGTHFDVELNPGFDSGSRVARAASKRHEFGRYNTCSNVYLISAVVS